MARVLFIVAMDNEANAILDIASGVREASEFSTGVQAWHGVIGRLDVVVGRADIGPVAAATATASILAIDPAFDVVISTGIAGAFEHTGLAIGDLVVSTRLIDADLGMESAEGFQPGVVRGWSAAEVACDPSLVEEYASLLGATTTPILTVTRLTTAAERIESLRASFPDAKVEAMEGIGVGVAARACGVPTLEIRAISNIVGPREQHPWDPESALASLADGLVRLGG